MSDGPNNPVHDPLKPPQDGEPPQRRIHYDYSRSSGTQGGEHWYSLGGNPLEKQKGTTTPPNTALGYSTVPPTSARPAPSVPTSRARERLNQRRNARRRAQQNWAWVIIALAMLGLTLVTSLVLIFVLKSDGNDQNNVFADTRDTPEPTSSICNDPAFREDPNYTDVCGVSGPIEGDSTAVGGALEGNAMEIEPWDGDTRLTILVMGMDNRPNEERNICRTDTIMLISIDPQNKTIGILSIPRDTYVDVPNHGLQRINTACVLGNLDQAGRGPELAMQTVQYNFGIRVHHYIMLDFNAFISMIDRIGGIDIYNTTVINDQTYPSMDYGYDPFYLDVGDHHLDGATALKYARSRHNSDDVDRQRRQQDVIFAVRKRVLELENFDNLLLEAPGIWRDLDAGIETSLSLDQILELGLFVRGIPEENISRGVVSWEYLFSYTTPTGGQVLVPRRQALAGLMVSVFGENYSQ